jgi:hypothetical protein
MGSRAVRHRRASVSDGEPMIYNVLARLTQYCALVGMGYELALGHTGSAVCLFALSWIDATVRPR